MNILDELENNIFLVDKLPEVRTLITWSEEKGQIWVSDFAVVWKRNNTDVRRYILSKEWQTLTTSRGAVSELCGLAMCDVGITYAQMARQVSNWLGVNQISLPIAPGFIPEWVDTEGVTHRWHFQHCEPCHLDHGYLNDMRAAYWSIAAAAPSLLCEINYTNQKVIWLNMSQESEEKWNLTKRLLEPYKKLRLAIIGVNSTGLDAIQSNVVYYAGGSVKSMPGIAPTNFRTLALLTVRCAYEITQLQRRELKAWYANADCVISEKPFCPYWNSLGIAYRTKHKGKIETFGVGQWKVGEDSTKPYDWKDVLRQQGKQIHLDRTIGYDLPRPSYHEEIYRYV